MDSAGYTALTRQSGLAREMQIVANNIANAATTGYRAEGLIFSEYVAPIKGGASLSMGQGNVASTSFAQGALSETRCLHSRRRVRQRPPQKHHLTST